MYTYLSVLIYMYCYTFHLWLSLGYQDYDVPTSWLLAQGLELEFTCRLQEL